MEEILPVYDFHFIDQFYKLVIDQNTDLEQYFEMIQVTPYVFYYEDILEATTEQVQKVVDFVGVDAKFSIDLESTHLRKQATN
jgi:LPS sulfotransferase NodH